MERDIERLFLEEIREKKRTGNGVYSRKGKGIKNGLKGALRTPFQTMTRKEKKALDGPIRSYNMYSTIIPLTEFILKDEQTQKQLLTKWREVHSNKTIMDGMRIKGAQKFNDILKELDIPKKKAKTGGRKAKPITIDAPEPKVDATQTPVATQPEPKISPEIINGLSLAYHGDYDADQLAKLFTKLQLLTDGEENRFKLALTLIEITE